MTVPETRSATEPPPHRRGGAGRRRRHPDAVADRQGAAPVVRAQHAGPRPHRRRRGRAPAPRRRGRPRARAGRPARPGPGALGAAGGAGGAARHRPRRPGRGRGAGATRSAVPTRVVGARRWSRPATPRCSRARPWRPCCRSTATSGHARHGADRRAGRPHRLRPGPARRRRSECARSWSRRTPRPRSWRSARSTPASTSSTAPSSPSALDRLSADNAQGEYYLTDVVAIARADGRPRRRARHRRRRPDRGRQRPGPAGRPRRAPQPAHPRALDARRRDGRRPDVAPGSTSP